MFWRLRKREDRQPLWWLILASLGALSLCAYANRPFETPQIFKVFPDTNWLSYAERGGIPTQEEHHLFELAAKELNCSLKGRTVGIGLAQVQRLKNPAQAKRWERRYYALLKKRLAQLDAEEKEAFINMLEVSCRPVSLPPASPGGRKLALSRVGFSDNGELAMVICNGDIPIVFARLNGEWRVKERLCLF